MALSPTASIFIGLKLKRLLNSSKGRRCSNRERQQKRVGPGGGAWKAIEIYWKKNFAYCAILRCRCQCWYQWRVWWSVSDFVTSGKNWEMDFDSWKEFEVLFMNLVWFLRTIIYKWILLLFSLDFVGFCCFHIYYIIQSWEPIFNNQDGLK